MHYLPDARADLTFPDEPFLFSASLFVPISHELLILGNKLFPANLSVPMLKDDDPSQILGVGSLQLPWRRTVMAKFHPKLPFPLRRRSQLRTEAKHGIQTTIRI